MDQKPVLPIIFGIPGLEVEKEWADFFRRVSPFGFILFARNLKEPKQIKRLVYQFHEVCDRDDLAILIDEEGGRVQRLPQPKWKRYPSARSLVEESAEVRECKIVHSAEINKIFFQTLDEIDCVRHDPSILR